MTREDEINLLMQINRIFVEKVNDKNIDRFFSAIFYKKRKKMFAKSPNFNLMHSFSFIFRYVILFFYLLDGRKTLIFFSQIVLQDFSGAVKRGL